MRWAPSFAIAASLAHIFTYATRLMCLAAHDVCKSKYYSGLFACLISLKAAVERGKKDGGRASRETLAQHRHMCIYGSTHFIVAKGIVAIDLHFIIAFGQNLFAR